MPAKARSRASTLTGISLGVASVLVDMGCSHRQSEIGVFAAASLKEVLTKAAKQFESQNPGTKLVLNFAGSQQLAMQINQGAPCGVFASADAKQMKVAEKGGRIQSSEVKILADNQLVVVAGAHSKVNSVADLAGSGVVVVLADSKVPAGAYALKMLAKGGPGFVKSVIKNVRSYEQDVRAVLAKVELGEADAGIVYRTDALVGHNIRTIELPTQYATTSEYSIAPIKGHDHDEAGKFVQFLTSPQGKDIFEKAGFEAP